MGIFTTVKAYMYGAVTFLVAVFMGWVWFLKNSNDRKDEDIENLEKSAKVQDKVHQEDVNVAEFKGVQDTLNDNLNELKTKAEEEYNKVQDKEHKVEKDSEDKPDPSFTFV